MVYNIYLKFMQFSLLIQIFITISNDGKLSKYCNFMLTNWIVREINNGQYSHENLYEYKLLLYFVFPQVLGLKTAWRTQTLTVKF